MLGSEIKTQFENIIDDSVDSEFTYQLMNIARVQIEGERDWEFLKKLDTSKTRTLGDTYATEKDLPSDFVLPTYMHLADSSEEVLQIPFQSKEEYKSHSDKYFIDVLNSKYYLTGIATETKVINFFYIHTSDDIEATTSPIFPTRFHTILAFYMAMIYYNVDFDDVTLRGKIGDKNLMIFITLKGSMAMWDTKLKLKAIENKAIL